MVIVNFTSVIICLLELFQVINKTKLFEFNLNFKI